MEPKKALDINHCVASWCLRCCLDMRLQYVLYRLSEVPVTMIVSDMPTSFSAFSNTLLHIIVPKQVDIMPHLSK